MSEPTFSYPVIDLAATGQNLSRLRKETGFTVTDLQEYLGLASLQSLYKWFRGENLPTVDNLYALSRLFGVTINDILVETRFSRVSTGFQMKDLLRGRSNPPPVRSCTDSGSTLSSSSEKSTRWQSMISTPPILPSLTMG